MEFTEYEKGDFLFFGKYIEWKDGNLEEEEYKEIFETFKRLLPFYKKVMEEALKLKKIRKKTPMGCWELTGMGQNFEFVPGLPPGIE